MKGARTAVVLALVSCVALSSACTIAIPVASGVGTAMSNRKAERRRAAGDPDAPKKQSVGAHVLTGIAVGALFDALFLYVALVSVFDDDFRP